MGKLVYTESHNITAKFKMYNVPLQDVHEAYTDSLKESAIGNDQSVLASEDQILEFERAEYSHFDKEAFGDYLDMSFVESENNICYLALVENMNLLKDTNYTVEISPLEVFNAMEKVDFTLTEKSQGRNFVEYTISTDEEHTGSLTIAGITDPDIYELIEEENSLEVVQIIIEAYTRLAKDPSMISYDPKAEVISSFAGEHYHTIPEEVIMSMANQVKAWIIKHGGRFNRDLGTTDFGGFLLTGPEKLEADDITNGLVDPYIENLLDRKAHRVNKRKTKDYNPTGALKKYSGKS